MSGHTFESMEGLGRAKQDARADESMDGLGRAKQDARADESMEGLGRAKQDARADPVYFFQATLCQAGDGVIIAAGPRWSPRDGQSLTPSGPEGSSGSDDAGCRGAAGAGHSQNIRIREIRIEAGSCARLWLHYPISWQMPAGKPRFLQFTG